MPVTAPTSSAMVTTRMASERLIFQLVRRLGTMAGNISLVKYCTAVGRNERIMPRNSGDTPRMASSESIRKTGPQTATSTKQIRNSTPRNLSTANRIQDTTGTAMNRRINGWRKPSSFGDRYMAVASSRPNANERTRAPRTRATVTTTSTGVIVSRLCPMRTKLGMANAGTPMNGARCDSNSQTIAKASSESAVWRENAPGRPASRYSSGCIEDLGVRHLLIEAGFDGALHHVGNGVAGGRLPGRLDRHLQALAGDRRGENAGRQLGGIDRDLVGGLGLLVQHLRDVLQRREQHLGRRRHTLDRIGADRGHDLPTVAAGDLLPSLRAVEDDLPARVLLHDDAGQRLDDQR